MTVQAGRMLSANVMLAFLDNADPGAGGWLVLAVWFVLFVLVLNTVIFALRRLFRRLRGGNEQSSQPIDRKEVT